MSISEKSLRMSVSNEREKGVSHMSGFQDIVGHKQIIEHLKNAEKLNKVSHAYIFSGEKSSGKKLLASRFAELLQCEGEGEKPCGKCRSCRQAESGNHPDIIRITHEKPNTISVDDIREQLVGDVQIKPYQSKYKIYIVPDAEKMNVQAQNALLKTIEEPPAYAVILFLTTNAFFFPADDSVKVRGAEYKARAGSGSAEISDGTCGSAGLPGGYCCGFCPGKHRKSRQTGYFRVF